MKIFSSRLGRLAAAGVLAASSLALTTGPATAAAPPEPATARSSTAQPSTAPAVADSGVTRAAGGYERCPDGYICLFQWRNGTGPMAWFKYQSPDLRQQGMNDTVSSVWNRTPCQWVMFEGLNYTGWHEYFFINEGYVTWPGGHWSGVEDNVSSLRISFCP
ncbi:hypothetical protein Kfla_5132 [Kribbella flavida DSM 17836]|uniref:Peptidase inhibitor family I36 n=1 Tax=Kribbella flavida (strain DSM 17836 / JCM 10339 / NBRC 14399) TaxID=479435 RepID=D2Q3M5_KRIFD|nr:peptidase inhibitor family I36 protein [Kribbella flavida]ADB34148.1 hypothetical protein Kfla_5132 [Kribbella flavida DSM 17836]